jgi:ADP-heptose:LPS heptosyltransferase
MGVTADKISLLQKRLCERGAYISFFIFMSVSKKINSFRRNLIRGLTRGIGQSNHLPAGTPGKPMVVQRVLICRPNHRLGNLLLITPLLQEVTATFPGCRIDLLVKGGVAPTIFQGYEHVERIISLPKKPFKELLRYLRVWISLKRTPYDLVINVVKSSSSGRLATRFSNAAFKIFGDETTIDPAFIGHQHIARYPVYQLRNHLATWGIPTTPGDAPPLDLRLSTAEQAAGQTLLRELTGNDRKTISVYTYATGDKCYSSDWWTTFYNRLKTEFPHYNIIEVLPVENISMLSFQAPTFYSKDIRAIAAFIAATSIFVGADSGIMHLATASHAPTVGLFSITDPEAYQPYGHNSLGIDTRHVDLGQCMRIIRGILEQA